MGLASVVVWLPAKRSPTGRRAAAPDPSATISEPESPGPEKPVPETTI